MKTYEKLVAVIVAVLAVGAGAYFALFANNHGNGTLDVYVQDAPLSNVSAVYITFTNVSVHGNQTGWQNYTVGSETINILGLTASNASLLKGISLSAQKYTMIRLYITNVTATINGVNVTFNLMAPFAFINHPFNVTSGQTTKINFEFNLNSDLNLNSKVFTPNVGYTVS